MAKIRARKGSVGTRSEYLRKYRREWIAKRRKAFFEGKACVICGSTDALELDHVDPASKLTHRVWSWSKKRFEEEIAKCQVLCWACHRRKTNEELRSDLVHGTLSGYKTHKCRCDLCRAANRDYVRGRRWMEAANRDYER